MLLLCSRSEVVIKKPGFKTSHGRPKICSPLLDCRTWTPSPIQSPVKHTTNISANLCGSGRRKEAASVVRSTVVCIGVRHAVGQRPALQDGKLLFFHFGDFLMNFPTEDYLQTKQSKAVSQWMLHWLTFKGTEQLLVALSRNLDLIQLFHHFWRSKHFSKFILIYIFTGFLHIILVVSRVFIWFP